MDLQKTLDWIEQKGGVYVWEAEVKAIDFSDCALSDSEIELLLALEGLQQLAINIDGISTDSIIRIAKIEGVESLVLFGEKAKNLELIELNKKCLGTQIILGS